MSYGLNGRKRGAVNSEFREIENLERLGIAQTTFIPNLLTFTKFLNLPNNSLCSRFALCPPLAPQSKKERPEGRSFYNNTTGNYPSYMS
jgi:hypothetical protein